MPTGYSFLHWLSLPLLPALPSACIWHAHSISGSALRGTQAKRAGMPWNQIFCEMGEKEWQQFPLTTSLLAFPDYRQRISHLRERAERPERTGKIPKVAVPYFTQVTNSRQGSVAHLPTCPRIRIFEVLGRHARKSSWLWLGPAVLFTFFFF